MKRCLVIILACIMCVLSTNGQEHLKFYNIPIDGDLKTAVKLVKKELGLKGIRIKNIGMLMGELDGEEVYVALLGTPDSKIWCSAFVNYDGADTWDELWAKYQTINASLKAKYGEPAKVTENWETPFSPTNNPIQALKENKAILESWYFTEQGFIMAVISDSLSIMVAYVDKENISLLNTTEGALDKMLGGLEDIDKLFEEGEEPAED